MGVMKMRKCFVVFLCLWLAFACCGICESETGENAPLYIEQHPGVLPYDGVWLADRDDVRLEIDCRADRVEILVFRMTGELEWTSWEYLAEYEEETGTLKSLPDTGMKSRNRGDAEGNILESVYEYSDGAAVFSRNAAGELLWKDEKEDAGAGLTFKGIGAFAGKYLGGNCQINMVWNPHESDYDVDVSIREDESTVREWVMKGTFHPENGTLSAVGLSTRVTLRPDGSVDPEADPDEGEVSAEFSFDRQFRLQARSEMAKLEDISFEHVFVPLWLWSF
ncbi:MAG: hypothetical protein IJ088_12145 [Clostridia bacterium]|nr:hypothetical protein [Clostridia bacterium]